MELKRLFQLLVVGGTLVGVGESCGGSLTDNKTPGSTQSPVNNRLPDGGVDPDAGSGADPGGGVGFW